MAVFSLVQFLHDFHIFIVLTNKFVILCLPAWPILTPCSPRQYPYLIISMIGHHFMDFLITNAYFWGSYKFLCNVLWAHNHFFFNVILSKISGFHYFQAAIGKDIIDVTLIARRCTRRNGILNFWMNIYLFLSNQKNLLFLAWLCTYRYHLLLTIQRINIL